VNQTNFSRMTIVFAAFLLSLIALTQPACRDAREARPTIVYLVRHAEKALSADKNPPLSEAGVRRAEALAQTLGDAGVAAIYTTQFKRTIDTAAPLSARTGIAVTPLEVNHENTQAYVEQIARDIAAKHVGKTVVVVSHSNTLPLIVERLGGKTVPAIKDDEYANLFVVTMPAQGTATSIRARYGE
jgi:broad specificity phosphatase PhoE